MTAPTRRPNASRPYPIAEPTEPEYGPDHNGWVPVIIAGVVAAFAIAVAGVIAGLVVVNIRENDTPAPKPTPTAAVQAPAAIAPIGALPTTPVATPAVVVPDNLDPVAVQRGIVEVLSESYGLAAIKDVKCPEELPVVVGSSYECSLRIDGLKKTVAVTVTDQDGTYEVSRPH
ncbi:DUF4333 domain-containing protein [Nocardia goodfellowii]|uniref:DUF4333 domain-containing protein n=1 Tax=Nocardia goodfellowii TaxID=882446 RepID=A0ABS4QH96_9NOCA|nr:DUF4333 domain-containing protein [Nocardia goodfellowii]MBP2191070.1 hypothetical protein [Nocardia goodfellowii]